MLQSTIFLVPTVMAQGEWGHRTKIGGRSVAERLLTLWSGMTCRAFGLHPAKSGSLAPGPVMVVSNHISWLDIQLLHSAGCMAFVGKAEIADWPLAGYLASKGGTIYHKRGSHDSASGVHAQLMNRLNEGGRVAIYPEGGILPGDDIKRFHARMFKVAVESACSIQPAMIRYTRKGKVDPDVSFIRGESFAVNILRLMGRPATRAELRFLETYEPGDRPRKDLAMQAELAVREAFEAPVS